VYARVRTSISRTEQAQGAGDPSHRTDVLFGVILGEWLKGARTSGASNEGRSRGRSSEECEDSPPPASPEGRRAADSGRGRKKC